MDPTLTVVTYNLWGFNAPSDYLKRRGSVRGAVPGSKAAHFGPADAVWPRRRARLLRTLEDADPDVIAVQENARRPHDPQRSHARQLARSLGMSVIEGTFYPGVDTQGQPYEIGLALLSHLPVMEVRETALADDFHLSAGGIPRVLQATLDFEDRPLHVWNVHFPVKEEDLKLTCARKILEGAAKQPSLEPLILCGDLNSQPGAPPLQILTEGRFLDTWAAVNPEGFGATMPSQEPVSRLDYLLLREGASARVETAEVIGDEPDGEGFYGSDHRGVKATLLFPAPDNS
jgi:endonuclease/exonuclease/phosphatase family metal-dependent hydrolase